MTNRRRMLASAVALSALGLPAFAQRTPFTGEEIIVGSPSAPVTLIEYGSLSCSHCARFHNEVFHAFKAKHVDTGQVRFIFREMLAGDPNFAAFATVVARCAGRDQYFDVVDNVFRQQASIYEGGELRGPMLRIAQEAGLSEKEFTACISDRVAVTAVNERARRWGASGVTSTPTFEVNGKRVTGVQTLAQLEAFIAENSKR